MQFRRQPGPALNQVNTNQFQLPLCTEFGQLLSRFSQSQAVAASYVEPGGIMARIQSLAQEFERRKAQLLRIAIWSSQAAIAIHCRIGDGPRTFELAIAEEFHKPSRREHGQS